MRRLLFIIAMAVSCTTAATAQVNIEGWKISRYPADRPTGCIMQSVFENGVEFGVIVTTAYQWGLGFYSPKWNLKKGGMTDVAVFVDRKLIASGNAIHADANRAFIELKTASAYKALQAGQVVLIQSTHGQFSFSLRGTANAMEETLRCVQPIAKPAAPSAQQQNQTPAPQRDFAFVPQAELMVMVTNLLSSANVQGYRMIAPREGQSSIDFVLADGTSGSVIASRGRDTMTADEYVGRVTAGLSQTCKGDVVTAKKTYSSTDGSVVRQLLASCRKPGENEMMEITVYRNPQGLLMSMTQKWIDGAGASADLKQRDMLTKAALKSAGVEP